MTDGKRKGAACVKRISEGARRGVVKIEVVEDAGVGGEEYVAVGQGN